MLCRAVPCRVLGHPLIRSAHSFPWSRIDRLASIGRPPLCFVFVSVSLGGVARLAASLACPWPLCPVAFRPRCPMRVGGLGYINTGGMFALTWTWTLDMGGGSRLENVKWEIGIEPLRKCGVSFCMSDCVDVDVREREGGGIDQARPRFGFRHGKGRRRRRRKRDHQLEKIPFLTCILNFDRMIG